MKEKLKFIPVNLFTCIGSFIGLYLILSTGLKFSTESSVVISLLYYLESVLSNAKSDYLEDKISMIEKSIK